MRSRKVGYYLKPLLTVPALSIMFPIIAIQQVYGQQVYYAGYLYYWHGHKEYSYHERVWAEIYTIDPSVPSDHAILEWTTIMVSYDPDYWVQVGYYKGWYSGYALLWYHECITEDEWYPIRFIGYGPSSGTWHSYMITHPYSYGDSSNPGEFRFYIDLSLIAFTSHAYPYIPADETCRVEVKPAPSIVVDGSHFKELRVFAYLEDPYPRWDWIYWVRHDVIETSPYYVEEVSDYEFKAWGGGRNG